MRPLPVSSEPRPLGILLISGGHERAHYAFVMAAGAAALGREVVLFATNEGVRALCRDPAAIGGFAEGESRLLRAGVGTLAELRAAAAELGVRRIACEAGMRVASVEAAMLEDGVAVAGVATFLGAVGAGQVVTL